MEKTSYAVIGGTGFEKLFSESSETSLKTPYGIVQPLFVGFVQDRKVAFLPRHGSKHSIPPHRVNYRANVFALHAMGVERILATNAVGGINKKLTPGDAIVPDDFVDFTKSRCTTFYDGAPVTHVDFSKPYCPEIRGLLVKNGKKRGLQVGDGGVLVCTEGPRFETPAEIRAFGRLGFDVVGMTGFPEVVLARELEICYGTICYVSNMAAGLQKRLTTLECSETSKHILPKIENILIDTIKSLPPKRKGKCPCGNALRHARFQ